MDMKTSIFWDIMWCSTVKSTDVSEKHRLHPQGRRVSQARNQREAGSKQAEDGGDVTYAQVDEQTDKNDRGNRLVFATFCCEA
jgi:hypothetical protein